MSDYERYQAYREPPRSPWSYLRWVLVLGLVAGALVLGVIGMRILAEKVGDLIGTAESTVEAGLPAVIDVLPGSSARQIGDLLAEAGVLESAGEFERYVRDSGMSGRLQAGVYELTTGMELSAVAEILVEGPGGEVYRITVIEGLTLQQMLQSIARQTPVTVLELQEALLDGSVESSLLPEPPAELADWEGLLFPDTYELAEDAEAADILARMAATAEDRIEGIDWSGIEELGLTRYDGIIIASMIEREALLDEERPLIASVVFNRLAEGMLLQIDATVVYAIGGTTELSLEDLEVDSPYNTYRYPGLPPTPIAGARLSSLQAAAAPAETDYLYYVLTDAEGRHAFTDDFDEFLRLQEQAQIDGVLP